MVRRIVHQHEVSEVVAAQDRAQRGKREVGMQVGVDRGEGSGTEQRQRLRDAARGLERRRFRRIADSHPEARTVAQRRLDLVAEMRVVDHQVAETRDRETLDQTRDERLSTRLEQRLRRGVGQRAHPLAAPGGQKHHIHLGSQNVYPARAFFPSSSSTSRRSGFSAS
jgi:hypothetical protein